MKRAVRILCLLLALMMLIGCAAPGQQTEENAGAPDSSGASANSQGSQSGTPERTEQAIAEIEKLGSSPDDNYRTFYEIFVYSFCDSNGDGIGDLQGVISRLDYLEELGVNGIWFMPIHPSQSYHKYDVRDYYDIDPAYGTLADFETLMAECEARDIHVITDLVLNHTGNDHEWFTTACKYLQNLPDGSEPSVDECPYFGYYYFKPEAGPGYHQVPGTSWYYEGMFSPHMPDLNLGNETVREEIKAIMQFWIDKGVAGFRLDAAKEFYSGSITSNVEVLAWIQETATALKPDCYLVAEVWENFGTIANYYESGITSIFNFAFGNSNGKIAQVLRAVGTPGTVATYATALETADKGYSGKNPNYIDAPFMSNHDVGRIAGFVNRDQDKIKLAGAMNIFMSGSCFIYYGEELGMLGSGNDPSKRAPMVWNEARDNGTTNPPPECELPEEYPFGSLETQENDDNSIYNYYRQAIAIRKALPVISHGRTTCETALNVGCISAQRKNWDEESCIILMNIDTAEAQVDLSAYADWTVAATLTVNETPVTAEGTNLTIPAYGVVVLIPNP